MGGGGPIFEDGHLLTFLTTLVQDGRLFKMGTNSSLGALSNKYKV